VDTEIADPAVEDQINMRWSAFRAINAARRATREFDGRALPDQAIRELLQQALLAPSSGNLQPYQLHWVRDPKKKAAVAEACNRQQGAISAATLIVVVTSHRYGRHSVEAMKHYVETTDSLEERSKQRHIKNLRKFTQFLHFAPLMLWSPLKALLCLLFPSLTLMPIGPSGARHWAARNSMLAAQSLLLAASARGIDSCPMEGFSASKVSRLLDLPRHAVIPVIIALGYRRADALVEPRWRRTHDEAVVVH
jgi:nitroreductase